MRTEKELIDLFTTYFSDRLSPAQIDCLVNDVLKADQIRRVRWQPRHEIDSCAADD